MKIPGAQDSSTADTGEMSRSGLAGDGELHVMAEAEMAMMREEEGARVVERDGRYWAETFRGFYQPIHQLAPHAYADVRRPTVACWGYRAVLAPADAHLANGAYPVHLLEDLAAFTQAAFEESRQRDLRKCRRQVEIVRSPDPEIFLDNGWSVYQSAKERVPQGGTLSRAAYVKDIERRAGDPRRLLVAGLIDGRLAGYLESYAVDGILYGRDLYVATEAMRTGIATGLYLETFEIGIRSRKVGRLCLGPELRERSGLAWFKKTLGVPVVRVPTRVVVPRPIATVMRISQPAAYYRITGLEPEGDGRRPGSSDDG
jgi:hypothetical protein